MMYILYVMAGVGAGIVTGLAMFLGCLVGAAVSAKYANRCEIRKLNRVVGCVLMTLGIVMILLKII